MQSRIKKILSLDNLMAREGMWKNRFLSLGRIKN